MPPKKAILILALLFLISMTIFAVLWNNNSSKRNNAPRQTSKQQKIINQREQATQEVERKTRQEISEIMESGKNEFGGLTQEAADKLDEAVNEEIMAKMKLRTPEQIEADKKRAEEVKKMDEEIN